ncbi:hypothetical protein KR018_003029, partial [Drosophila ironensis]
QPKQITREVKMRILRYLRRNGYSQENLRKACQFRNVDYSDLVFCKFKKLVQYMYIFQSISITAYIGHVCESAEESLRQDCNSVTLNHVTQWLELMKEADLPELCEFEAATVLNSIVRNEKQPRPADINGVDLKQAYKFLENGLMGQPQNVLDEATKGFLSREIELLIEEVNTDELDKVVCSLGNKIYHRQEYDYVEHPEKCSRDPFFLDDVQD